MYEPLSFEEWCEELGFDPDETTEEDRARYDAEIKEVEADIAADKIYQAQYAHACGYHN